MIRDSLTIYELIQLLRNNKLSLTVKRLAQPDQPLADPEVCTLMESFVSDKTIPDFRKRRGPELPPEKTPQGSTHPYSPAVPFEDFPEGSKKIPVDDSFIKAGRMNENGRMIEGYICLWSLDKNDWALIPYHGVVSYELVP